MKRSVVAATVCLGIFPFEASAANFSIKGSFNQSVDASDNYFLSTAPSGAAIRALSALYLDFLARTPTTNYTLKTNYSYYKYFGPGADDTATKSGTPAGVTFNVDHNDKLNKYNLFASWQRADVAATQLAESGVVSATGTIDTYVAGGGVTHQVNAIDSVSWSTRASTVSFSEAGQTPYVDRSMTGAWTRRFSPLSTLTTSLNVDWFTQDDANKSERLFWTVQTALQSRVSDRLTVSGSVGFVFVNAYQTAGLPAVAFPFATPFQVQPGTANGWQETVGLTYQLLKSTQVSLTAGQSISPTILGQLQKTSSAGVTVNHTINSASTLAFSSQFTHLAAGSSSPIGGASAESDFITTSVSYGYRLSREFRSNLSYTYRHRTDATGVVTSSTVLVSLAKDLIILPETGAR